MFCGMTRCALYRITQDDVILMQKRSLTMWTDIAPDAIWKCVHNRDFGLQQDFALLSVIRKRVFFTHEIVQSEMTVSCAYSSKKRLKFCERPFVSQQDINRQIGLRPAQDGTGLTYAASKDGTSPGTLRDEIIKHFTLYIF